MLERAKRNDQNAWRILVELYAPLVYTRCRKQWNLAAVEAENVGQEVFIAVARKLKDFQRQRHGSFRKWLRTITDNKCKNLLTSLPPTVALGGSAAKSVIENICAPPPDSDDYESEVGEKAIVMRQALKAIESEFSDRDLKIFWSIAVDERIRQHVATEWQVTDNVVYLAYSRIRKRLREIYHELLDDELGVQTA
jgi:RNA polymerase sigma-70 factor (ECF subfamily)